MTPTTPRPDAAQPSAAAHHALPAIEHAIRAQAGNGFHIAATREVGGGSIHTALRVEDATGAAYFVKLGDTDCAPMFDAEADGLAAIAASGSFRTPAKVVRRRNLGRIPPPPFERRETCGSGYPVSLINNCKRALHVRRGRGLRAPPLPRHARR